MGGCDRTDADLLREMAGKDEGALRELYDRHATWIHARLARRCADPDAVAEVLQDTFIAAWDGAARFRGDGAVGAWLWGIAIRRLISRLRRRTDVRLGPALLERDEYEISAEEQVLLRLENVDVGTALGRISPELRVVLQLTVIDGLTTREASALLGIPRGTVKSRLQRARTSLREELA
ncbi:RNA polymerase sigma factor [Nocardioides guangzhouensis]|uniref:RNA polymerase sigma factor n=1 Tax=Nocardioides guangzhouensis TaxID=2497878 RepID=A0A4Q4Z7X5_9ACTN|nr:RNA polymerase sigma factor [Nocardioides guangzhouensis]RYP83186.1 RNA polymerase sigma factor [Nocardioides guangzhouensis]